MTMVSCPGLFDHPYVQGIMTKELERFGQVARAYFGDESPHPSEVKPQQAVTKSQWLEYGRFGFLGLSVPRELGGGGLGHLGAFVLSEALSRTLDAGLSLGFHVHNDVAMGWLLATKQHKIRDMFLPEMLKGRLIGCTCFTERGDVPMTTAIKNGNRLTINGQKAYAINGVNADLCFVTAELDGKLCTIVVEKDTPGVRVSKIHNKLGASSIDQADIAFDNVVVDCESVVSSPGLQQLLHWNDVMTTARAHVAFDAFMMMKILFEHMSWYSEKRVVGGKTLSKWPVCQQEMSGAFVNLELVRANLANYVRMKTQGTKSNPVEEMAALKHFAVEKAFSFGLSCCDMEGGKGYMNDSVSLHMVKQIMALRYSTGSQYKTKEIASAYHREKHKRLAGGKNSPVVCAVS